MSDLDTVRQRIATQRLSGRGFESVAQAVRFLGAVQAQEFAEAKWSLAERLDGEPTDAEIEAAFDAGEIVRTHVLRPTWHFVVPEDLRWMQKLTGPRVSQATQYWFRQHGLDEDLLKRGDEIVHGALAGGEPMTRKELGAALGEKGVDADGPRLGHIMIHAELEAIICSGPRRGKQHTYRLIDDLHPDTPELPRRQALAELTRRYFLSHGPATLKDFSWWSGLTLGDARTGVEALGEELECEMREQDTPWYGPPKPPRRSAKPVSHLIPMYDELGVAYQDLRMVYAERPADGLMARPILIDGVCVGSWKRTLQARSATLEATLITNLSDAQRDDLAAVGERFGRFLELPIRLETEPAGT